ncbi:hypothetical protein [Nocardia aurantiaca]|nr:hypothetical protein [Nocardia aurantiaca]
MPLATVDGLRLDALSSRGLYGREELSVALSARVRLLLGAD